MADIWGSAGYVAAVVLASADLPTLPQACMPTPPLPPVGSPCRGAADYVAAECRRLLSGRVELSELVMSGGLWRLPGQEVRALPAWGEVLWWWWRGDNGCGL